jgi:flagellar biosynthesis/type III secretory pathway M-ring protein FliF/YscJ
MDIVNQAKELFQVRRYRAVALAIVVLIVLAVIQINHLQVNSPMSELFNGQLNRRDVERIQLAFGNANLNGFQIQNNRILVPQQKRAEYLKAITEQNAVPRHLQTETQDSQPASIFMSRSQQQSLARIRKKEQIRKMVTRLPFVEQAWFEMDVADSHSAFNAAAQTAVISIEPTEGIILDAVQVDTVTRIIKGAIAGITADQIQVIDIHSGYAHNSNRPLNSNQVSHVKGLPALEQQNYFENRIRRSLTDFPGTEVAVKVDVVEIPAPENSFAQPKPTFATPIAGPRPAAHLVAGTNGFASIYDAEVPPTPEPVAVAPVSFNRPTYATKVKVDVAVPQALVESYSPTNSRSSKYSKTELESAFERLRSQIVQRVRPLLPEESTLDREVVGNLGPITSPVSVRLVRSVPQTAIPWHDSVQQLLIKYWPSAVVLLVGLLMISTMHRGERHRERIAAETESLNADILSINSSLETRSRQSDQNDQRVAEAEEAARREAELRLHQLVEKNPDSTQRVLENWIKDAA